jgi:hypothetical protein
MDYRKIVKKIIKAETGDKEEYQKFFKKKLKEHGVNSPEDFKTDAERKKFFNEVDAEYEADHEEKEAKVAQDDVAVAKPKARLIADAFASYVVDDPEAFGDLKRLSKYQIVTVPMGEVADMLEAELTGEISSAVKRGLMGVKYNKPVVSKAVDALAALLVGDIGGGLAQLKVLAGRPKIADVDLPADELEAIKEAVSGLVYRVVLKTLRQF